MDGVKNKKKLRVFGSLRIKVAFGVILPLMTIMGVFTLLDQMRERENTLNSLSTFAHYIGRVIENDLRHQMLESDFEGLQQLLITIGDLEEVQTVSLIRPDGEIIFSSNVESVGEVLDQEQPECQLCHKVSVNERPQSVVVEISGGEQIFRNMQPIENDLACIECHESDQRLLGVLLTDISVAPINESINAGLKENLMRWGIALLLMVFVVIILTETLVLRRLLAFAWAINRFGEGHKFTPLPDKVYDEIGEIARAFNKMAQLVAAREEQNDFLNRQLQTQSSQRGELLKRVITAQEDERKRIARELHDELGQTLGGLAFRVKAVEANLRIENGSAVEQLNSIQTIITRTTEKMYDLILDLRPSSLDDFGLVQALRTHTERTLGENGTIIEFDTDIMNERLPPELETALFRVFQEALNNVHRHASASQVAITLSCKNHVFEGAVLDNGSGFDLNSIELNGENPRGLGLLGMKERVTQFGGKFSISSSKNNGTRVGVSIPLEERCG